MADTYEKDLGQKASLTTSDFIRVVGSDNVSYKQRVSDVADVIIPTLKKYMPDGTDASSMTEIGDYYATWTNVPSGVTTSGYLLVLPHYSGKNYRKQIYSPHSNNELYIRTLNNGTWTAWEKLPTRAEVDALSTFTMPTGISFSSKLSNTEITIRRCGKYVVGNAIFRADQELPGNGETILTNLPYTNYRLQVMGICLAGSEAFKAKRFAIYNGTLSTYWSGTNFVSGDTWLVNFSYIATN